MTGFINLNKAVGASSASQVAKVRRLFKVPCGHMGTLDPMASGVLPIAIGNAARLFDYFLKKEKTYVATFRFGEDYYGRTDCKRRKNTFVKGYSGGNSLSCGRGYASSAKIQREKRER